MRHRLLARLLGGAVLIAVCSITATAWLTARGTSGAIEREQGQTLAADAKIYDTLLGYAAVHPDWAAVALEELARTSGRRIALTGEDGTAIADSAPGRPLPPRAAAVVNPLAVDVALASGDRIDPRAVAPFGLPESLRVRLLEAVEEQAACLQRYGQDVRIGYGLSGRPHLEGAESTNGPAVPQPYPSAVPVPAVEPVPAEDPACGAVPAAALMPRKQEEKALRELTTAVNRCLARQKVAQITLQLDGTWAPLSPLTAGSRQSVQNCLIDARREQLDPFVAPPAVLYIGEDAVDRPVMADAGGVAAVAALVLLLTVGVSVVLSTRLLRPVHALTAAAQRMRDGDPTARVKVRDRGELGRLATAFNEMSAHLEQLERQRKDLISDVSHELRTPLSVLRSWLEAAQDGLAELDPPLLAALVEELLTLQRIVGDLQELALADAGALRLHPERLDLAEFVPQVAAAHRGGAEACGLTLTATVAPGCTADADPIRLRQILNNLLTNAIRHTPTGGRVSLDARPEAGRAVITVSDTGTGIPEDELPHVFDRFWRSDKSRTRQTGGSGLGLAIVRTLTEAHNATITVTSTPNAGTTFTLHL